MSIGGISLAGEFCAVHNHVSLTRGSSNSINSLLVPYAMSSICKISAFENATRFDASTTFCVELRDEQGAGETNL